MIVVATVRMARRLRRFIHLGSDNSSNYRSAIALLDGWATVGDVLTFYQERIANEGYLRTATERRSILELARLVGYKLRPVSLRLFISLTRWTILRSSGRDSRRARSQSIPNPGETPQSFETSES
jgi:hypothetical protein